MDGKLLAQVMAGLFLAGCVFDSSGVSGDGGPSGPDGGSIADGGAPDGPPACTDPLALALQVNGEDVELSAGGPPAQLDVLVGDVLDLGAALSCVPPGELTYEWQIMPDDGTADPGLNAEALSFYPTQTGDYMVQISVRPTGGAALQGQLRITAHGWEAITATADGAPVIDVQDMDVSDTDLWIASSTGSNAYRLPLTGAQDAFSVLNSELDGAISISGNTAAVYYSRTDNQVWFGSGDSLAFVTRLEVSSPPPFPAENVTINDADALNGSARVRDIGPGATGVAVATDQGITETADGLVFTGKVEPNGETNIRVIAGGGGQSWAGARLLYDLDNGANLTPFGGTTADDNKIRALAVDVTNGDLWVGSQNKVIARVDNASGAAETTYASDEDGLAFDEIRQLRVETAGPYAGDVWAATKSGIIRYIRARDTWITLGDAHGLTGTPDVKAIVIDEANGRRVLYAGTQGGVFHLRATP